MALGVVSVQTLLFFFPSQFSLWQQEGSACRLNKSSLHEPKISTFMILRFELQYKTLYLQTAASYKSEAADQTSFARERTTWRQTLNSYSMLIFRLKYLVSIRATAFI